jgi:hypothetical protein
MTAWLRERRAILAVAIGSRVLVLAAAAADHWLHWPKDRRRLTAPRPRTR